MVTARRPASSVSSQRKQLALNADGTFRFVVLSDTHSAPHPLTAKWLERLKPDAILHAGDIGTLNVLDELIKYGPLLAVRGNIDARRPDLPDVLVVELLKDEQVSLRLLLLHIGVYGAKLQAHVARLARSEAASIVVCGHSHVPFIGGTPGLTIFNPGSIGPRRYGLPIVFGTLDVSASGVRLNHIDAETGLPWAPP